MAFNLIKMKKMLLFPLVFLGICCHKPDFEINSETVYSPGDLQKQAKGPCQTTLHWEGKPIRVRGRIDQPDVFGTQNGGKFQLRDERGFIDVYVEGAPPEAILAIHQRAKKGLTVLIAGKAMAWEQHTQAKCTKHLYVVIDEAADLLN